MRTCIVADDECNILPVSTSRKNELLEALVNKRFEEASRFIASHSEANLVECVEGKDRCSKTCLHVIAALSDGEPGAQLCRQLLQKIDNALNREYLLNVRTVDEFEIGGQTVRARVAAIHIAAYNGNSEVVRQLCKEYGVDVNCNSETLEEKPREGMTPLEWAAIKGHIEVIKVLLDNKADLNARRHSDGSTALCAAAWNLSLIHI